jgi:hypothetical protein
VNAYSGFTALGIEPKDDFQTALDTFAYHAERIGLVGSALAGDTQPLSAWRSLCESMDWLVKQPTIRQPVTTGWCLTCGAENRVPVIEKMSSCERCGNPAYCYPVRCTRCGITGGVDEDTDVRIMPCPQCNRTTVERIAHPTPRRQRR